jgi:(p)ppGpp synthase/HD superfamily hydrolase
MKSAHIKLPFESSINAAADLALSIAHDYHQGQTRKADGSPYINHLREVLGLLQNVANVTDDRILIAGVLHDSLEDTDLKKSEIQQTFGVAVLALIDQLTDDKSKPLVERREAVIAHLEHASDAVKLIKLADITSNANALPNWDEARLVSYLTWLDAVALKCSKASKPLYAKYLTVRAQY